MSARMKVVVTVLAVLTGLLSIAAGAAKVALVPNEAEFLAGFGLSEFTMRLFGIVQIVGGLLLAVPATRIIGGLVAATGFAVSAALIFASGNVAFGGVSLVPVSLALLVAFRSRAKPGAEDLLGG